MLWTEANISQQGEALLIGQRSPQHAISGELL